MTLADSQTRLLSPLAALVNEDLAGIDDEAPAWLWERALFDPLRTLFGRPGKGVRAQLVDTAWRAAGGAAEGPPELLPMLTEILHAGSLVIDDIEDDSAQRRGGPTLHREVGLPIALNAGNLLYFWPQRLLERLELRDTTRLAIHRMLARTLLDCHRGQALDLSVRVFDLARREAGRVVRATTRLKTGSLMAFAAWSGAVAAGAEPAVVEALERFGRDAGIGLQMLDDLSGIINDRRRDKAVEDLRLARPTWIWAWLADAVDEADYAKAVQQLRYVAAGASPTQLRAWLKRNLAGTALARARAHVARAADAAEAIVPEPAAIRGFRAQMKRLEESYVREA